MNAKIVFAQWYVSFANICWQNSGNAIPIMLRNKLCPASADDANGP